MFRSLIIVTALVCGGSATLLVNMSTPQGSETANAPQVVEEAPTLKVLAAVRPITQGVELTEGDLGWIEWPRNAVHSSMVSDTDSPDALKNTLGNIARMDMFAGQPILPDSFANTRQGYLSSLLSPGMRAVAIKISAAKTAGGFILPNNRVDILLTQRCDDEIRCRTKMSTDTILQNVRVLAIDQSGSNADADGAVLLGKTATLELSPDDAEQIIAAEASGNLSLLLRSIDDNEIFEPKKQEVANLTPEVQEVAEPPRTVKVTRGGVSEIVVLN
ncbi:Flp pilus assembly protein CpaB [Thalassovita mediterranea]|jgi:pilus assembly protein CpaB|uniref:Flp pilus assembly protein CpaB n=1 Tax=Thalassovita mediterranea TaxID=340021 RepID=A0A0P1GQY5_9RHOB|nr:Flp pilus assembly protein CpaB [Thalassovita mediterranea]CUH84912.1 Flp pilus assembly protein CpaB [Thalassovita mediterranea]SIS29049.1 pilus assembly protein CpaB [Thalassovita mediterranea]